MTNMFGRLLFLAVASLGLTSSASAATPVEYVKICSLYGAGYYYIPGMDVCINALTGDTHKVTPDGIWSAHSPTLQGSWVPNRKLGCGGQGELVELGPYSYDDLTLNAHEYFETGPTAVALGQGEYVANVMVNGGFNVWSLSPVLETCTDGIKNQNETATDCGGTCQSTCEGGEACTTFQDCRSFSCDDQTHLCDAAQGDPDVRPIQPLCRRGSTQENATQCKTVYEGSFGLAFRDSTPHNANGPDFGGPLYSFLGSQNTTALIGQEATRMFTPLRSTPPSGFIGPIQLIGTNADEFWPATGSQPGVELHVEGEVSFALCIRSIYDTGTGSCADAPKN